MKFVHIADVHFDRPFTVLEEKGFSEIRRLEQRNAFRKVIEYIKINNIPYLFISGDLYEIEYVKQSTIEYINKMFNEIPETKIFIVPGNHDPYIKGSPYANFTFGSNVKIFTSKLEKVECGNINIYGYGFEDFYMKSEEQIDIAVNQDKVNILLTHCALDGAKNDDTKYNPILKSKLQTLGLDYVALGHIHKPCYMDNIVYPGSLISLGFDELGPHGMIVGDIKEETKALEIEFISVDEKEFIEIEIDVTDILSKEELIEKINDEKMPEGKYIKIVLIGNRKIELNLLGILKYLTNPEIIKIKDKTKLEVNLNNLSLQNNLKGIFVKRLLKKIEEEKEDKEKLERAIEIGLSAFEVGK